MSLFFVLYLSICIVLLALLIMLQNIYQKGVMLAGLATLASLTSLITLQRYYGA